MLVDVEEGVKLWDHDWNSNTVISKVSYAVASS